MARDFTGLFRRRRNSRAVTAQRGFAPYKLMLDHLGGTRRVPPPGRRGSRSARRRLPSTGARAGRGLAPRAGTRSRVLAARGSSLTSARQMERTRTSPFSRPERHLARTNPSSRAPVMVAHASSKISRLSVSSHDSPRSGRPPGHSQRDPSVLTRTTSPSCVTQKALAPCGCPGGASTGGCQAIRQSPSLAGTASPQGRTLSCRAQWYSS